MSKNKKKRKNNGTTETKKKKSKDQMIDNEELIKEINEIAAAAIEGAPAADEPSKPADVIKEYFDSKGIPCSVDQGCRNTTFTTNISTECGDGDCTVAINRTGIVIITMTYAFSYESQYKLLLERVVSTLNSASMIGFFVVQSSGRVILRHCLSVDGVTAKAFETVYEKCLSGFTAAYSTLKRKAVGTLDEKEKNELFEELRVLITSVKEM